MNLLPEKDKILAKKEYLRRLLVVSGIFFICVMAISSALLFPALLFLSDYKSNVDGQIAAYAKKNSNLNTQETEKEIKRINFRLNILENKKNDARLNYIFIKIIKAKTASVKITRLAYEKSKDGADDKILISGKAGLREDLLIFEKMLKKDFGEQKILSPISNLLKEKDADFYLTVYIPNEK